MSNRQKSNESKTIKRRENFSSFSKRPKMLICQNRKMIFFSENFFEIETDSGNKIRQVLPSSDPKNLQTSVKRKLTFDPRPSWLKIGSKRKKDREKYSKKNYFLAPQKIDLTSSIIFDLFVLTE